MTIPLTILAAFALLLGLVGTPAWPWFHSFLSGTPVAVRLSGFSEPGLLPVMVSSSIVVFLGLGLGWYFYGRKPIVSAEAPDAVGQPATPHLHRPRPRLLRRRALWRDSDSPEYRMVPHLRLARSLGMEWRGANRLAPGARLRLDR